jgi:Cu/Ag efflux protein CusF
MKAFNATLQAAILAAACLAAAPALADNHGQHVQHNANATADTTDGEIKKVDKASGKLTIKHGELKNMGMGAMTMVFRVKDAALLDKVKAGDKVRFTVENAGSGMTVTAIDAVK